MDQILWDIDGTLIQAGTAAEEPFADAIHEVTGQRPDLQSVAMSGKTDPQIVVEILARLGYDHNQIDSLTSRVVERLPIHLSREKSRFIQEAAILPGIQEILAAIDGQEALVQSLLTGNLADNARFKMASLGLDHWFDWRVGAFGSDHEDRPTLVTIAMKRFVESFGRKPRSTWIIGDTPKDFRCARDNDVHCLLVATGDYSLETLSSLGADRVVADLADTEAILRILTR